MHDRLAHLNPAQRTAVETHGGPVLVLAGAGTGKTRVITYRMAELIHHGVRPDRILSVTFTNKAAREMQTRTADLLGRGRKAARPLICTFHALCVRILRQEIEALGYPNTFTIYDRGDQEAAARSALREVRVPEATLRPGDLLSVISRWKMARIESERAADAAEDDIGMLAASAYRRYQRNLKACAAVDFDDLLFLTDVLFTRFPEALARQQSRFEHLQIDEYQDTNDLQFRLVEAMVRQHHNICVVGDDDQSIYGWRGAEVRHILGFQQIFPGTRVIRLEDNYRCTDQILALANRLVRCNRDRHDKQLIAHKFSKSSVRVVEYPDELAEAEAVVREVAFLVRTKGVQPGDVAILFRTNEQPRLFETELRRQRLPYVVLGSMSFFDRREVRDLLAYLRAIEHPRDEIALLRIINVPARGIGEVTVEKLLSRAVREKLSFWDALPAALAAREATKSAAAALEGFRALLLRYRERLHAAPRQMHQVVHELIAEIQYEAAIEQRYDEPQQQVLRMATVEEFIETLSQYEQRTEDPSLAGFLEEAALVGKEELTDKEDQLSRDGVKLMTLHSAKGLEFPRVYLVGLEEGLLPHQRSIDAPASAIEEERRLAYVGVTRARDFLTLSRAGSRMKWGKRRGSAPSRFLFEMLGQATPATPEIEIEYEF